ncbi:hypothetical protein [Alkalibacterium sp. 20]|uniref:hypothetical protein n=1 Tax=Alkalibacterium sp. 20 TaxID=1798803 RepID=UPI0009004F31|nr:hypothetical protein [Alkalibacterium sp. 20]OJF90910.1 hypothetical protein AX762_03830 [Alkalibacterium sp. 20]
MTLKWNRETFLVTLTLVTILFGFYYYGNQFFVESVKQDADQMTQLVSEQQSILETYAPSEELLADYEQNYSQTESYLPLGDDANKAMITLEQLAARETVSVTSVSRISDREVVEELPASFVKNIYQAEVASDSPENLRKLIDRLMNEERMWNVTSFSYAKAGEDSYTGTFTFELFYYFESSALNLEE